VTICGGRWYLKITREISICLIGLKRVSGCHAQAGTAKNFQHILPETSINK